MPRPPVPKSASRGPLAIVGASVRSAAASAARAGFHPLAADLFADADLRRIATATRISPYPEGLLDWLRAVEPPAWMYTGAMENHPELVDQMAWIAPLWGNSGDVLTRVRSPWELGEVLRSAGLLFPETRTSPDGLPRDGSWLAKTYRGASGSGVREWGRGQGAGSREPSHSLHAPCSLHPASYQRRIGGTPCAAAFVAANGAASLLGVARQFVGEAWLGAHGFQYAGSVGPWPLSETATSTIGRIGDVLADAFDLVGLFGVDMILDGEQIWTLEVNPRFTASVEILERATGIQAIAAHAAACAAAGSRGQGAGSPALGPLPVVESARRIHGKAILFARRELVISDAFAASTLAEALVAPWPMLADVSAAGTRIEKGRPILTLFAHGSSGEEVEQRLRDRVAKIDEELYCEGQ